MIINLAEMIVQVAKQMQEGKTHFCFVFPYQYRKVGRELVVRDIIQPCLHNAYRIVEFIQQLAFWNIFL